MENISQKIAAFEVKGVLTEVSEKIPLKRIKNGSRLYKKHITLKTGNTDSLLQEMFIDVVNLKLKQLEKVKVGDTVKMWISFRGYRHEGRNYNNIYCHSIEKE